MKMPNILFSIISIVAFLSCNQNEVELDEKGALLFELQFINAGMSGKIIKKEDLEFNEFIEFSSDSTFIKRRVFIDSTSIATGSYTLIESDGTDYFELNYEKGSYLIQSCGNSLKEWMSVLNDREIFNGGYLPCDGPGYGYKLIKS